MRLPVFYPTRRAVLIAAALAPATLAVGLLFPAQWMAGLALVVLLVALIAADGALAGRSAGAELGVAASPAMSVGERCAVEVELRFPADVPRSAEAALAASRLLHPEDGLRRRLTIAGGVGLTAFGLTALRRGRAALDRAWIRWQGPLGLSWRQRAVVAGVEIAILPDIRAVREKAAQLLSRDAGHGLNPQLQIGEGAEFEALTDYRPGLDRRAIDWKQSARHHHLLAKEFRTERNNTIILAIDAGRTMSDPVAGVPRVDRAVSAALLTAFAALRDGDRVGLFSFDSHPGVASNPVSGTRSFALLQRIAAGIDYSPRETNYTLALSTLAARLTRRSLLIVFTEVADTISAELMIAALGPLLRRHLLLFVMLRDEELERFAAAEPLSADDVTRAVTAAGLLEQRRLVTTRLRRLGVEVVEARHDEAGPALLAAYLGLKRRNRL